MQSGVKSNKILTEALNSKGITASESGPIIKNVSKVKEIKTDPSINTTNVTKEDILEGKTAYSNGHKITGSIKHNKPINKTITLDQENIILPKGYYDADSKISSNISNLLASNIKKEVKVDGVTGIHEGGGKFKSFKLSELNLTPTGEYPYSYKYKLKSNQFFSS